ncbi:MAG: type II toxin-antitoxin system HicB family antitoxin [Deltaproteobacteria bacterium]|jgi:predicted RNase H-like HicB family nuclease|nr:type II toxin-antitoxin system HicB family antitoxin [Deltaproteobacteria bacterium]
MYHYPACLIPYRDGSGQYGVVFPDLPGCVSVGNNLAHALAMAQEAMGLHLSGMLADNDVLPIPSTPEGAQAQMEAEAQEDNEPLPEGTLYQYILVDLAKPAKKIPPVHLSISLKPNILADIDVMADELGLTRSGVIAAGMRDYISRMRG